MLPTIASRRAALLDNINAAVRALLGHGMGLSDAEALRCDNPLVRDVCEAVEGALAFQLLPPLFSFGAPTVNLVLWHLQQAARRRRVRPPGGGDELHPPAEAVALARGLSEKHLASAGPLASAVVHDACTARLWICLGLQRRALADWVGAIGRWLGQAYADGALMTTADELGIVVDLLRPLAHLPFALLESVPTGRTQLVAFLGLPTAPPPATAPASNTPPKAARAESGVGTNDEISSGGVTSSRTVAASNPAAFDLLSPLVSVSTLLMNPPSLASTMRGPGNGTSGTPQLAQRGTRVFAHAGAEAANDDDGADGADTAHGPSDAAAAPAMRIACDAALDSTLSTSAAADGLAEEVAWYEPYVPYEPYEPFTAPASDPDPVTLARWDPEDGKTRATSEAAAEMGAEAGAEDSTVDVASRAAASGAAVVDSLGGGAACQLATAVMAPPAVAVTMTAKRSHRGLRRPPVAVTILDAQQDPHAPTARSLCEAAEASRAAVHVGDVAAATATLTAGSADDGPASMAGVCPEYDEIVLAPGGLDALPLSSHMAKQASGRVPMATDPTIDVSGAIEPAGPVVVATSPIALAESGGLEDATNATRPTATNGSGNSNATGDDGLVTDDFVDVD